MLPWSKGKFTVKTLNSYFESLVGSLLAFFFRILRKQIPRGMSCFHTLLAYQRHVRYNQVNVDDKAQEPSITQPKLGTKYV